MEKIDSMAKPDYTAHCRYKASLEEKAKDSQKK